MIQIDEKIKCCGCTACSEVCPVQCIKMSSDQEGFLYPRVDSGLCLDCGLCETVCPMNKQERKEEPLACFAARANDLETRINSSSGGVFSLIAQKIVSNGGIVFGARFDRDFNVVHSHAGKKEDLACFYGSKYAQSNIGNSYQEVKSFLKEGKEVLFSGTPCQIAGLKSYLRTEYPTLYTVSVICHGVPSPRVWHDFLKYTLKGREATSVNMRSKNDGWRNYSLEIKGKDDILYRRNYSTVSYMKAFLRDLILRPSCYDCPFKGNHGSDLILGDFWGGEKYQPDFVDDLGTSAVLVYSNKGFQLIKDIPWATRSVSFENVMNGNPSLVTSSPIPNDRDHFWDLYLRKGYSAVENYFKPTLGIAVRTYLKRIKAFLMR